MAYRVTRRAFRIGKIKSWQPCTMYMPKAINYQTGTQIKKKRNFLKAILDSNKKSVLGDLDSATASVEMITTDK